VKRRFRNGWAVKLPLSHAPLRPLGRAKLPVIRNPLHASNATILVAPKEAYHSGHLIAIFSARQEPRPPEEEFAITEH